MRRKRMTVRCSQSSNPMMSLTLPPWKKWIENPRPVLHARCSAQTARSSYCLTTRVTRPQHLSHRHCYWYSVMQWHVTDRELGRRKGRWEFRKNRLTELKDNEGQVWGVKDNEWWWERYRKKERRSTTTTLQFNPRSLIGKFHVTSRKANKQDNDTWGWGTDIENAHRH